MKRWLASEPTKFFAISGVGAVSGRFGSLGFRGGWRSVFQEFFAAAPLGDDATMLAAMHEKIRYNIRVAEKRGVSVQFSSDPADVAIFYKLLAKTGERAGIRLHEAPYYSTMMKTLASGVMLDRKGDDTSTAQDQASREPILGSLISDSRQAGSGSRMTNGEESHLSVELAIAEHLGHPVAVAMIAHYGDRAIY